MLRDVTIGQYIDIPSPVHKLDPRTKIIWLLAYLVILFCPVSVFSYIAICILSLGIIVLSRIPVKFILRGLKPMIFILAFTVVVNLFATSGEKIWAFKIFGNLTIGISKEGIQTAIFMCIRLVFLVMISSLLTLTTSPMALTDGIESLLSPFAKIGVPSHEIAMMMTIAIRFIPTLAEETDKIMKAQTARGADFESGNIIKRTKAMIPLMVPLFVSAFRRADELATAMDARCYCGGKNRTRMNVITFGKCDIVAAFAGGLFVMLIIAIELLI